jgi:hypothetical protein
MPGDLRGLAPAATTRRDENIDGIAAERETPCGKLFWGDGACGAAAE